MNSSVRFFERMRDRNGRERAAPLLSRMRDMAPAKLQRASVMRYMPLMAPILMPTSECLSQMSGERLGVLSRSDSRLIARQTPLVACSRTSSTP